MRLKIIRIGNSFGIKVPKMLLKQCGFKNSAIARAENGNLILSPAKKLRQGWLAAFKKMAQAGDDKLLD